MHARSRLAARVAAVTVLAGAAVPGLINRGDVLRTLSVPAVHAMPAEVSGYSAALLRQAATHQVPMIFLLEPGSAASQDAVIRTLRQDGATNISQLGLINAVSARVGQRALTALRYDGRLSAVQLDQVIQPDPIPNLAQLQEQESHANLQVGATVPLTQPVVSEPDTLSIIKADVAQEQYTGRDVRVAIIDSGIDLSHPDLQGVMLKGPDGKPLYRDFTNTDLTDTVGHGTACAGTIVAQGKTIYSASDTYTRYLYPSLQPGERQTDRTYFTDTGVAPGVKLMVAKVFDTRADASTSGFVRAIEWAIQNHADVISESWGAPDLYYTGNNVTAMADEEAVQHGITVVVANGNSGPGAATTQSPGSLPDVISAGASTDYRQYAETGFYTLYGHYSSDSIAAFTSEGPTPDGRSRPDIFAPGEAGWATFPQTPSEEGPTTKPYSIGSFAGTSMATPVTAGVAALVINAYRESHAGKTPAPALVKQILQSSADDLGYAAQDQAAGRINAYRAVQMATRKGASVLLSGALALEGLPGQQISKTITLSNTGQVSESISVLPQVAHQTQAITFKGTVVADNNVAFHFKVPAGTTELKASANFASQQTVPIPGESAQNVILQVALYDPQGNLVNAEQSFVSDPSSPAVSASGYASTTGGHPIAGTWTAVVSEAPRRGVNQVRHYVTVPFVGHISLLDFAPSSTMVSPASFTLKPGEVKRIQYRTGTLGGPGVSEITVHVREHALLPKSSTPVASTTAITPTDTVETIPAIVTSDIPVQQGLGLFSGSFVGGIGSQGFARETRFYDFKVPSGVHSAQVAIEWSHQGNLFLLGLIDPTGKINNVVDNAFVNPDGSLDLTHPVVDAYLTNPAPGTWRIVFMSLIYAGSYTSEPFKGAVVLGQPQLQASTSSLTVKAGASPAKFSIAVRNTGITTDAYYSYATSDQYTYLALGGNGGSLQAGPSVGVGATTVLTYTTSFVPPGTREVITQAQSLNTTQPLDIELDDSAYGSYAAFARQATVSLGGKASAGDTAIIQGDNLPIGQYFVSVTLPNSARSGQVYVASSTQAYALSPQPWIKLDAQRRVDGSINQNLLVARPSGIVTFHGQISVPATVAPGTYRARVYIYTYRDDLVGMVPLTVTVQPPLPAAAPTPDPLLATVASAQYFPEGAAATGVQDQMDLVNPGSVDAHVQLRLINDGGWTTLSRYLLPAHSRKTINVQPLVGNNQVIAAVVQADQTIISGRQIVRSGEAGSYSTGTQSPGTSWYFADGYTVGSFAEYLTVVNPGAALARIRVHMVSDAGDVRTGTFTIPGSSRRTVQLSDLMPNVALSVTLTSNVPVVAERVQLFGSLGQGVTTTIGAQSGSTSQYIDPGHLPASAQAHISIYNPTGKPASIEVTPIDQHGKTRTALELSVKAGRRAVIDLTASYHSANLGAEITSDVPVVAEKVAYYGRFKQSVVGGSDLVGVSSPGSQIVFPGGSTSSGASDYLDLYNPTTQAEVLSITAIYGGYRQSHRSVTVAAGARLSLDVSSLGVPSGASSLIVQGTSDAQFYATQSLFNRSGTDGSEVSGISLAVQ